MKTHWKLLFAILAVHYFRITGSNSLTSLEIKDIAQSLSVTSSMIVFDDGRNLQLTHSLLKQGRTYTQIATNDRSSVMSPGYCDNGPGVIWLLQHHQISKCLTTTDIGKSKGVIIIGHSFNESMLIKCGHNISINQKVYFVSHDSLTVTEAYSVNNIGIVNVLGWFTRSEHKERLKFVQNPDMPSRFKPRRRNLHGRHFVAVTNDDGYYIKRDQDFEARAKFHSNNKTFEVTNLLHGMHIDFLEKLAGLLNFTYTLYKREDGVWGAEIDGKPNGMLETVHEGKVELLAAPFSNTLSRGKYVNFLPPISRDSLKFFIKAGGEVEVLQWMTFLNPFSPYLWKTVALTSLLTAALFWLFNTYDSVHKSLLSMYILEYLHWTWVAFKANFGGKPTSGFQTNKSSRQLLLFSCLLAGNIIWISYRASITSELSALKVSTLFHDMESFYHSGLGLVFGKIGANSADVFVNAKEGSIEETILKERTNPDSFQTLDDGIEIVATSADRKALFDYETEVLARRKYRCKIALVRTETKITTPIGFALAKNSSFYPFLSLGIIQLLQQGHMSFENLRNDVKQEQGCEPLLKEAKPLSLQKLFTLFLFLIGSSVLSIGIFAIEIITPHQIKSKSMIKDSPEKVIKNRLSQVQLKLTTMKCQRHQKALHEKLDELNSLLDDE